ncbi:hypothetical protein EsH8_VII_000463 [Colletotrichum jinshuiense]
MAEALGFAASVIAVVDVAGKAVTLSMKIKSLWDEIKDVPSVLLKKAEEVQFLDELLQNAENQVIATPAPNPAWNNEMMQRTIYKARSALDDLQKTIDALSVRVTDPRRHVRKLAPTKAALRKKDVHDLEQKLDWALNLHQMAQMQYLTVATTLCTTAVLERLPEPTSASDGALIQSRPSFETGQDGKYRKKKATFAQPTTSAILHNYLPSTFLPSFQFGFGTNNSFQFSVQTPSWLTGSVYSVLAQRSLQGWQLNLRAYDVVEFFDVELAGYIEDDNSAATSQYLDKHKVTPFVRNKYNKSLLRLAVESSAVTVTNMLLDRGLGVYALDQMNSGNSDPFIIFTVGLMSEMRQRSQGLSLFELFSDHGLDDLFADSESIRILLSYGFSCHVFRELLKRFEIQYGSFSVATRLDHLRVLTDSGHCWCLEDLHLILPEAGHLDTGVDIIEFSRTITGCALLHSLAKGMAFNLAREWRCREHEQETTRNSWGQILHAGLCLDPMSLHHIDITWTPSGYFALGSVFSAMIRTLVGSYFNNGILSADQLKDTLQSAITTWVAALSSCNINLLAYGREERRLYEDGITGFQRRWVPWEAEPTNNRRFLLIGIAYGPLPEHWGVWWTYEYEDYAGEFWDMIEIQRIKVPGSWVDEAFGPYGMFYENRDRLYEWVAEETTPLIWSEYRKIRPPT